MTLLEKYLGEKKMRGEKILSLYLTAGFPTLAATLQLFETMADAGADLFELGMPFSDPLADGPVLQNASRIALRNGITISGAFEMLHELNRRCNIPTLLMGYANPFLQFGWEKLLDGLEQAGASGLIVPDLPPEESAPLSDLLSQRGLDQIHLASPNTPRERLQKIEALGGAFIYAVSVTGVTGTREKLPQETQLFLRRLRTTTRRLILVGFGISNAETVRSLAPYCDGVTVGSALIQCIDKSPDLKTARENIRLLTKQLKCSLTEDNHECRKLAQES